LHRDIPLPTDPPTDHLRRAPRADKLPHEHQISILDPSPLNLLLASRHRRVIRKAILRFHAIYYPAFLPPLNLALPRHILTYPHWAMNRRQMIKITGNAADLLFALSELDVDAMRSYLPHQGGIADDGDYGTPTPTAICKKGCENGRRSKPAASAGGSLTYKDPSSALSKSTRLGPCWKTMLTTASYERPIP